MFLTGEDTIVRFAVLAPGSTARPADGEFITLPNVSTSDLPITGTTVSKRYYNTNGGQQTKSTGATWTFSVSGDMPEEKALRTPVYKLRNAVLDGRNIYMERGLEGETAFEGGVVAITNATLPAPSDNAVSYSFTASGSGKPTGPHTSA